MTLEKLVEKFIDNDCEVFLDKEFCYYDDEIISISLSEDPEVNISWKEYLKKYHHFNLTVENVFIMSILHELGHHYTLPYFSDAQWEKEDKMKSKIEEKITKENAHACRIKYFQMPTEKAATAWAIEYYNANREKMKNWNHRFMCAIRHFMKTHPDYEITILTKI